MRVTRPVSAVWLLGFALSATWAVGVELYGPSGPKVLAEIAALLPESVTGSLPEHVMVRFGTREDAVVPVDSDESGASGEPLAHLALISWIVDGNIVVHEELRPFLDRSPASDPYLESRHRTATDLARAAVIEGLALLFDRSSEPSFCRSGPYGKLTGWQKWMLKDQWKNRNLARTPDAREAQSPEAHFAVNFGYYVLDSEFACRRPAMNLFFREKLGLVPHDDRACELNTLVFLSQTRVPVDLHPDAVQEVHYLLASPGSSMISGWGHTMIRFVVCDTGEDCMGDIMNHVVLGYQAMTIDDLSIDHIGGLLGKYPSLLFPYMFSQVESRYIAGELRELISVPVRFTETERHLFIYKCLEQYWQYSGRYRFLTHNCATETRDDFQGAFLRDAKFGKVGTLTPVGIAKKMHKSGFVDASVFEDEEKAIREGYYFPELNPVEELFADLKSLAPDLRYRKHKQFIKKSRSEYRRTVYARLIGSDVRENLRLSTLFFNFEVRIRIDAQGEMFKEAIKLITRDQKRLKKDPDASVPALDTYERVQSVFDALLPWRTIADKSGYGVPLRDEITTHENEDRLEARLEELAELRSLVDTVMAEEAPEAFAHYDGARRNVAYFAGEMDRYRSGAAKPVPSP